MSTARFFDRLLVIAALGLCAPATGAPLVATVPRSDEIVATQLLPRAQKGALRKLAGSQAPASPAERLAAVRRMIESGRASGDPRTLGYAESMLAAWPADARDTPVEALVLHATIAQSRHAFARARELLDRAVAHGAPGDPAVAQALLTRASIAQVTGDFVAARADCVRVVAVAPDVAAICAASVDLVAGDTSSSIRVLRFAAARTSGPVRAWALALLAQAHEQRGERGPAATAYQAALAAGDDLVTRLAYADFLLAERSGAAVTALLQDAPPTDGVVLRQWRGARLQRLNDAWVFEDRLRARLADARERGDGSDLLHARDWAQFELERGNAAEALRLAHANWRDQREPADLLVLAQAAAAARDARAREEVRGWLARTKLQDVRILAALEEPRP